MDWWLLLLVIAVVAALLAHACIRDFWIACAVATLVSLLVMGVLVLARSGFPIAVIANAPFMVATVGTPSSVVAAVIGWPFFVIRRARSRV